MSGNSNERWTIERRARAHERLQRPDPDRGKEENKDRHLTIAPAYPYATLTYSASPTPGRLVEAPPHMHSLTLADDYILCRDMNF
jgi:hypothetical protein